MSFVVLGLVIGAGATAEAKKPRKRVERTVEATYGPVVAPELGCNDPGGSFACTVVDTRPTERFFTAKVTDAHGQPVWVQVLGNGVRATFCGETTRPISFDPGSRLEFRIEPAPAFFSNWGVGWVGPLDCPYRIKTTGTISVTLSNRGPEPVPLSNQGPEPVQDPGPARSGSILNGTGWLLDSQIGGCQMSPECAAWLYTGCADGVLAEHDPGLTASIVDVDELADGPPIERVFRFGSAEAGLAWGGVQLQFWTSDCVEIPDTRWRSTDCDGDASGRDCKSTRLRIPPTAKWMTVTGYQDNVNLAWTLT